MYFYIKTSDLHYRDMLTVILFVIGIALTAVVVAFFGFGEVAGVLGNANIFYIILAGVLQVVILLMLALRMQLISRKFGTKVRFLEAFKISMAGIAISLLTPIAKVGGEPLKIYLLKKRSKLEGSKATAVIAVDTLAELVSSLLTVFLIFLLFAKEIPGNIFSSFVIFLVLVTAIIAGLLRVLTDKRLVHRIVEWSSKKIARYSHVKKRDYAKLFYESFTLVLKDVKIVTGAFLLSLLMKIVEFARMWLVFAAIGILLPADVVIILWAVILVLYMVPWLPGSLGLVEFFGAGLLVFFGLTSSAAAGGILIDRLVSFWFVLALGLAIASTMPLPKGRASKSRNYKSRK